MKLPRRTAIWIGLGLLLTGLGGFYHLREPSYEGKSLSEWLKDFDKEPLNLTSGAPHAFSTNSPLMPMPRGTRIGPGRLSIPVRADAWQVHPINLQIVPTASVVTAVRKMGPKA